MRRVRVVGLLGSLIAVASVWACGDASTTDNRGYTKAPLEQAGVIIKPEGSSAMDSLGSPVMPRDTVIAPEPAAPAATTTTGR